MIPTEFWRGTSVSRDMVAPLDSLAKATVPYIRPIPGFGSYRTNTASAGTDSGSGHVDLDASGWTVDTAQEVVKRARERGFVAWYRPASWWSNWLGRYRTPGWQSHIHMLLRDSADLSPAARAQIVEYDAGGDGLYGPEADTGYRGFGSRTWAAFQALQTAVTDVAGTIVQAADKWTVALRNQPVNLWLPITASRLRLGARSDDVKRLQAALWNWHGTGYRRALLVRHKLGPANVTDGSFGPVTGEMVRDAYRALAKAEPGSGWTPDATEPGRELLRRIGFTTVRP